MAERAYSIELQKDISAIQASNYSIKGELHDMRAFQCNDPNCRIRMTCTNWNQKGIRYYFRPSFQDELHVIGCSELSAKEIKEQEKLESDLAKESIRKNGIIKMTKSIGKAKNHDKTDMKTEVTGERTNQSTSSITKKKSEARHVYPIASFVHLFEDATVDNDSQIVAIEKEKISLNDLFIQSNANYIPSGCMRIIYGEAVIRTADFGKGMLEIEFSNSKFPKVYSNIQSISKNKSVSDLKKYLDTNKTVVVYYRGKLIKNGAKFESFNEQVFKDIHF